MDDLVRRIRAHERTLRPARNLRQAAVLVPLVPGPDGLRVVFTLRPSHLPSHPGQVSFPGGTMESVDATRWDTALREANEELDIPRDAVTRVGVLDDYTTVTGYHVTPCVGLVPDAVPLVPCPREVEQVFTVDLGELRDPGRRRTMRSRHPGLPAGDERRLYFYLAGPHVIWGATPAMLTHLLEVTGPA